MERITEQDQTTGRTKLKPEVSIQEAFDKLAKLEDAAELRNPREVANRVRISEEEYQQLHDYIDEMDDHKFHPFSDAM